MAEQSAASGSGFRIPANAFELLALGLAFVIVIALIQLGAPFVRELEFLDPKLRDYFIGVGFVAFPLIHRQCKRALSAFTLHGEVRHDLTPWYVTGVFAAALLFAWNQFVSACAGLAVGILHAQIPVGEIEPQAFVAAIGTSMLAMSLPMSAVASVFAGILLNRNTRSHVFAALSLAAVMYLVFNVALNYALMPEVITAQIREASAQGPAYIVGFFFGMGFVALIVLVFGAIGIAISRFNREKSLGRIIEVARRLSAGEREQLAAELARRFVPAPSASGRPATAAASFAAAPQAGPSPAEP
jgi:hypothetical protein